MADLAGPSCVKHFTHERHDIAKLENTFSTHESRSDLRRKFSIGHREASFPASGNSTPSRRSSLVHCPPKEQLSHCLEQYRVRAQEGLDSNSAKEAVFWCCLGLGTAACSQLFLNHHAPLSAESRTDSTHSIDTVSDSGFAPSFDTGGRHCLSLDDPDVENSITNLVGGLAGVFVSDLLNSTSMPHDLSLPEVSEDFVPILSRFGLAQNQHVENILEPVSKVSTHLLSILQNDYSASDTALRYWILCLEFVIAASEENVSTSNSLRSQLVNSNPPHCLTEPARSYIVTIPSQGGALGLTPFPTSDSSAKSPRIATRFHHRTRSRATSLMSHTSLHSFSSIRSFGRLSAKSPATLSLSHDFRAGERILPSGSFIMGSSRSALGALDSLAENFQVQPRPRGHSITTPNSPLGRTMLSRSTSDYSFPRKGNGKENTAQLPQEGVRPGTANLSVRTGTRFAVTSPPTPSGLGRSSLPLPKMDPVLAALEKSSKLKSKSLCLNCGKRGDNYPCCPRCGEAWCSRECRIEANNGGKHVCKRAATLA
ncbi:hypothetical protein OPQ81_011723 [Rhizoctonia solani]|nr:hypothetical protein OPQ81_011723 [Rhizoctonia solani]